MKTVYYVTEGVTDFVVLNGLIEQWLGEDFVPRHIQPPSSDYAVGLTSNLLEGWKGVRDWCAGRRPAGPAGRDEALREADVLLIHTDADVAGDPEFADPPFSGPCPPARDACDWVRSHLVTALGGTLPSNALLCVPAQSLETWILCALHPTEADAFSPIECRDDPAALLIGRAPHRLVRQKAAGAGSHRTARKKDKAAYRTALPAIVSRLAGLRGR